MTTAEANAEEQLIRKIKEAEPGKEAAQLKADEDAYTVLKEAEAGTEPEAIQRSRNLPWHPTAPIRLAVIACGGLPCPPDSPSE